MCESVIPPKELPMNQNLTEIAYVLDRSGSMASVAADAIGGFNAFLADQQRHPGEARFTLVLFDHEHLVVHCGEEIQRIPPLDATTYMPRGTTALLDAIGRTVDELGQRLTALPEAERPGKVIVAILTDGLENASTDYNYPKVSSMIQHQQEKYNWEFVFLAANQNVIAEAGKIAIRPQDAVGFVASSAGVREAHMHLSADVASRRSKR